ncbi:MAG: hypothetical protein ACFFDW_08605 [Candidatus Thorarchaeota archaeon]
MAFQSYSYHYLIAGFLNIAILAGMLILLLRNFFRKRTVGTFLLILAYGSLLTNEVLTTTAFIHEALYSTIPSAVTIAKILQLTGVLCLVYTINWMYFFGNRHLIRDNDLFKSLYTSIFGAFIGVIAGLAYQDIIIDSSNPTWYSEIDLAGADFNLYYPSIEWPQIILIVGLFAIGSYTYVRLALRTFVLQRKAKDIVTKKGLRTVSVSIIFLLLTGLSLGAYIFGANTNANIASLLYVIRGFIVIIAVVTGYIGWIMPEWIRKRWRGTAWITKVYTGKAPQPPKSAANQEIIDGSTNQFVEVSDS